jgi:O-antigen ligase
MSLLFLGHGYCYSTLILDRLKDLSIIHSDILKSFVDYGFIGFCLWISYYVYFLPKKFLNESKSSMSKKTAIIMITFSIYAMITYLTDNTNVYFCFQTAYLLIPFAVLFEGMKRE